MWGYQTDSSGSKEVSKSSKDLSAVVLPRGRSPFQASVFFGCGVYWNQWLHTFCLPVPSFSPAGFLSYFHPKSITKPTVVMPERCDKGQLGVEKWSQQQLFFSLTLCVSLKPSANYKTETCCSMMCTFCPFCTDFLRKREQTLSPYCLLTYWQ